MIVLKCRSNELEHVGHGHVSSNTHSMAHAEWTEETLKRLPVLAEKSRGVKPVVIVAPDGRVVVDDVIQTEYNRLVALC